MGSGLKLKYVFPAAVILIFVILPFSVNAATCRSTWVPFKNHCYRIFWEPIAFHRYDEYCHFLEAKLLVINSAEENHFIARYLKRFDDKVDNVWLGIQNQYGTWRNAQTERFIKYTNWGHGQPDQPYKACAYIKKNGLWIKVPCGGESRLGICKMKK